MWQKPTLTLPLELETLNHKSEEAELFLAVPNHPKRVLQIGTKLSAREDQFKKFLSENLDVFAWSPTDMPRVDPSVICHKVFILPENKPFCAYLMDRKNIQNT